MSALPEAAHDAGRSNIWNEIREGRRRRLRLLGVLAADLRAIEQKQR
jgi:hypothetical protein